MNTKAMNKVSFTSELETESITHCEASKCSSSTYNLLHENNYKCEKKKTKFDFLQKNKQANNNNQITGMTDNVAMICQSD